MTSTDLGYDPNSLRGRAAAFLEKDSVKNAILVLIIVNAVTLGMSTSDWFTSRVGTLLIAIDRVILIVFVIELAMKLFAFRLSFFKNAWNVFDLLVVGLAVLPQSNGISALRGLRVLRALRLLSAIPQMRAVVQALLDALPGMGAVVIMLSIVYYVFAVMATIMYGDSFDEWFGTIGRSAYSLFQIMTLESWSMGIVRPVMAQYTYAWLFFVPFIIITAFSVLNLFIGLLVTTMQTAVEEEREKEEEEEFAMLRQLVRDETDQVDAHVTALEAEIRLLRQELREALNTPRSSSDPET